MVASHGFLPFIHFAKTTRKFKRDINAFATKTRPLAYAGHLDSLIFRNYNIHLSRSYESHISGRRLEHSVLAYRRFQPPKCNIHFANDAFRFVEQNSPCVALAFDIEDFFESLDHSLLKCQWKQVIGEAELPPDQYAVFKAITKYAKVSRQEAFLALKVSNRKQESWQGPMCSPAQYRSLIRPLIEVNDKGFGIPQGSGISALLANIYMMPVDVAMSDLATSIGGLYFRYSDDILIVCDSANSQMMQDRLRQRIAAVKLKLHSGPGKFNESTFDYDANGKLRSSKPLQYLGFSFDGQCASIRSQTFVRYLRKMKKAVRREGYLANVESKKTGTRKVRKKLLYSRYSHLGKNNFITYTQNAEAVFGDLGGKIRNQAKRHWKALHAMLSLE